MAPQMNRFCTTANFKWPGALLSSRRIRLAAAITLFFVAGCSGCDDDSADANNPDGTACVSNDQCSGEDICRGGECVALCIGDADCEAPLVCGAGRYCVPSEGGEQCNAHARSEERRVGKECRSRWSQAQYNA